MTVSATLPLIDPKPTFAANLSYLATPYSQYPGGIYVAFAEAAELAGRLLKAGICVYSPICHTHPIAIHANLDPLDHDIWLPFDQMMMNVSDVLIVAHMKRWEHSKGIAYEIEYFERAGKPIFDLNCDTLSMARRP